MTSRNKIAELKSAKNRETSLKVGGKYYFQPVELKNNDWKCGYETK